MVVLIFNDSFVNAFHFLNCAMQFIFGSGAGFKILVSYIPEIQISR